MAYLLPSLANMIWKGEGVLSHVWRISITALAIVRQLLRIAVVEIGVHAAFILKTQLWACGGLVGAPGSLGGDVDGLWVNPVLALGLDGDRGDGNGDDAGELDGDHFVLMFGERV